MCVVLIRREVLVGWVEQICEARTKDKMQRRVETIERKEKENEAMCVYAISPSPSLAETR